MAGPVPPVSPSLTLLLTILVSTLAVAFALGAPTAAGAVGAECAAAQASVATTSHAALARAVQCLRPRDARLDRARLDAQPAAPRDHPRPALSRGRRGR
jgi:hypothetical protein